MSNLCRLCACEKSIDELVSMKYNSLDIEIKLQLFSQIITITEDENLPQNSCIECIEGLDYCVRYVHKVNKAQESLKEAFCMKHENNLEKLVHEESENDDVEIKYLHSVDNEINKVEDGILIGRNAYSIKMEINEKENEKSNIEQWVIFNANDNSITLTPSNNIFEFRQNSPNLEIETNIISEEISYPSKKLSEQFKSGNVDNYNQKISNKACSSGDFMSYVKNQIEEQSQELNKVIDGEQFIIQTLDDTDKDVDGTIKKSGLNKLNLESWNQYPWKCIECNKELNSSQSLIDHSRSMHEKQSFKFSCCDCSKTFTKYKYFVNHVRQRHRTHLKYCCDVCCIFFWNTKQLKKHRNAAHGNVTSEDDEENGSSVKQICWICNKKFKSKNTLIAHQKSHLPDNVKDKFKCEVCDKEFLAKPNLLTHKRIHSDVREYTCEQCGKGFIQKGNLENHMITHDIIRPYSCNLCDKTFKTQIRLNNHKTIHSGLKPHQCEICMRQFREKGTLREHLRIHTGAMPFSCEFCGKRFRFKGILTTHRRQHTGERPYSCLDCNHHFTNWPNFNKHMKRRHGINTSVSVRKPQTIPPSGMPPQAKLNHIVPTADNNIQMETLIPSPSKKDNSKEKAIKSFEDVTNDEETNIIEISQINLIQKENDLDFDQY